MSRYVFTLSWVGPYGVRPGFGFTSFCRNGCNSTMHCTGTCVCGRSSTRSVIDSALLHVVRVKRHLSYAVGVQKLFFSVVRGSYLSCLHERGHCDLIITGLGYSLSSCSSSRFRSVYRQRLFRLLNGTLSGLPAPRRYVFGRVQVRNVDCRRITRQVGLDGHGARCRLEGTASGLHRYVLHVCT